MAISIPYSFTNGVAADAPEVNACFNELATKAVDKTGDTMSGNLVVPNLTATAKVSAASTAADALSSGGGLTCAGVAIVNTSGKIPALTSTYLASLSGAALTAITAANISAGTAGIDISGNAATATSASNATTVTNGVYTSGSYSNPAWITALAWSKVSSTPTTLSGYGITDAVPSTRTVNSKALSSNITLAPSDIGRLARADSSTSTGSSHATDTTWVDSGLSATLTMTSGSNYVKVSGILQYAGVYVDAVIAGRARIVRDGVEWVIFNSTDSGSSNSSHGFEYLDKTAGSGSHTYKVQVQATAASGTSYVQAQPTGLTSSLIIEEVLP